MHSLQNDFMIIDLTIQDPIELSPELIQAMSHRKSGIGFDQLLIISEPEDSSFDFRYQIYNHNGSEAEQCGNGARCITKYLVESNQTEKKILNFETRKKSFSTEYINTNQILVKLSPPSFQNKDLPCTAPMNPYQIQLNKMDVEFWLVSVGNPHAVIFQELNKRSIQNLAPKIAELDIFPEGVNVNFCTPLSRDKASLTVYERGSGIY